MNQKLDDMAKAFDKISNGTGFPPMCDRGARLITLEKSERVLFYGVSGFIILEIVKRAVFGG